MSIEIRGRENIVPIDMRVRVDDTWEVSYTRSIGEFAFEFKIFPMKDAINALEQVVNAMEDQSYDHGAEWRRTYINELPIDDDMYRVFKVGFRVRDSY